MNLTTENTAIVLDSTSDYPEAPSRFPNMRFVPLYVRFGDETFRDYVELGPAEFYEKLRTSPVLPATSQPTPQDFLAAYESLAAYERIYSLHVSAKLSGTFQSAELAAQELGGDKVRVVDSKTASLAIAMLAHAIQRRLARGTTDEEIAALVERFHARQRRRLHGRDARVPPARRPHRPGAGARRVAPERAPDPRVDDGEVVAVARVRGQQKALAEFERRFAEATRTGRACGSRSRTRTPEWVGTLSELVWRVRPKAEIEFTATLGAVVSTHTGPGAVGFFWFQDGLSGRD